MEPIRGRLELTWTNKQLSLLAEEGGGYEWVDPFDARVAETRLLDNVTVVGDGGSGENRAGENLLIRGDSLQALRSLRRLPEFANELVGKVKLIYIDPPFNTGQAFANYDDALEHSVWLTMMRDRLLELKRFLSPDGSIWVHLDDAEVHRLRCVMDEVFGAGACVGAVTWRASDNSNNDAKTLSNDYNTILVYAASDGWASKKESATAERLPHYKNPDGDPRGPYFDGNPLNSPNPRENLMYDLVAPDGTRVAPPPNGWRWSRETMAQKMASGEIRWRADYSGIYRRTYLADHEGLPPSNLWVDLEVTGHNRQAKNELKQLFPHLPTAQLFKTPKPERLMKRIVNIATDPGDTVLDCFAGSGTTPAVAHKMGRRWVAIERSADTVDTYTEPRLRAVVEGADPGGISSSTSYEYDAEPIDGLERGEALRAVSVLRKVAEAGRFDELDEYEKWLENVNKVLRRVDKRKKVTTRHWAGGGGFRVLEVADSMYEIDEDGEVLLSGSATNGRFAEAVRAQLGFEADDQPPFCGRSGRARLAVFDGAVGLAEAERLVGSLGEGDRLVLVAKAVDPDVEGLLSEQSPGSKIQKAPRDLLRSAGRVVR